MLSQILLSFKKFSCSHPALTQFKFANADELGHKIKWTVALWALISLSRAQHYEPRALKQKIVRKRLFLSRKLGFLWKYCLRSLGLEQLFPPSADQGAQAERKGRSGGTDSPPSTFNTILKPGISQKKRFYPVVGWYGKLHLRGLYPQFWSRGTVKWLPGPHGENTPQILTTLKCI